MESEPWLAAVRFTGLACGSVSARVNTSLLVDVACDLIKIGGEGDLAAIGRELVLVLPAEGKGRDVVIAGSEVAGGAGGAAGEQAALMRNRCERLPLS